LTFCQYETFPIKLARKDPMKETRRRSGGDGSYIRLRHFASSPAILYTYTQSRADAARLYRFMNGVARISED